MFWRGRHIHNPIWNFEAVPHGTNFRIIPENVINFYFNSIWQYNFFHRLIITFCCQNKWVAYVVWITLQISFYRIKITKSLICYSLLPRKDLIHNEMLWLNCPFLPGLGIIESTSPSLPYGKVFSDLSLIRIENTNEMPIITIHIQPCAGFISFGDQKEKCPTCVRHTYEV